MRWSGAGCAASCRFPPRVLLIPLKDLAMAGVWLVGCFRRRINWRGNELRIGERSSLHAIEPAPLDGARDAA